MSTLTVSTTRGLGAWVRRELATAHPDCVHILRVITQETGRFAAKRTPAPEVAAAVSEPPETGSAQWDALIEGIVAHRLSRRGMCRPEWTFRTQLVEGWTPNPDLTPDDRWYMLNVFHTPVELLEKGVILARHNLERL